MKLRPVLYTLLATAMLLMLVTIALGQGFTAPGFVSGPVGLMVAALVILLLGSVALVDFVTWLFRHTPELATRVSSLVAIAAALVIGGLIGWNVSVWEGPIQTSPIPPESSVTAVYLVMGPRAATIAIPMALTLACVVALTLRLILPKTRNTPAMAPV